MDVRTFTPKLRIFNHMILFTVLLLLFISIIVDHSNVCREYFKLTENHNESMYTKNHIRRKFYKRYRNKLWDTNAGFIEKLEKIHQSEENVIANDLPSRIIDHAK